MKIRYLSVLQIDVIHILINSLPFREAYCGVSTPTFSYTLDHKHVPKGEVCKKCFQHLIDKNEHII